MSNEGQSDYFATLVCAKILSRSQKSLNAKMRDLVPPVAESKCDAAHHDPDEQNLCYRMLIAAKDFADVFMNITREARPELVSYVPIPGRISPASFHRVDTQVVDKTLQPRC